MAKIPYYKIEERLKEIFGADSRTAATRVVIESSLMPTIDIPKYLAIYLKNCTRVAQLMGFGNQSREYEIVYNIEVNAYHGRSVQDAFSRRDELISDVENILQQKTTLTKLQSIITDTAILMLDVTETNFETPRENKQLGFISRGVITINITVRA